ncbi:hypothetical protein AGMMS49975_22190 [Clostridia bacterium]|nr:hypothetical protein AGMMS49975_22190 [Clostridia bacterium]
MTQIEPKEKVKWLDEYCHVCGKQLNSWDAKCAKALAYRNRTCEKCIAAEYDKPPEELRDMLEHFFGMRPCMGV